VNTTYRLVTRSLRSKPDRVVYCEERCLIDYQQGSLHYVLFLCTCLEGRVRRHYARIVLTIDGAHEEQRCAPCAHAKQARELGLDDPLTPPEVREHVRSALELEAS